MEGTSPVSNSRNRCFTQHRLKQGQDGTHLSCDEEVLDHRVQAELERLNQAADEINGLELDLDEARSSFRSVLTESSQSLNGLAKKLGKCIENARPYYEARLQAREALAESQRVALKYERACSMHEAAKEMVQHAEIEQTKKADEFDSAWQEMLNHATNKVNEAEKERMESEAEHLRSAHSYYVIDQRVQRLQRDLKRAVAKSRPYFDMIAKFNQILEEKKNKISSLEKGVAVTKAIYSEALRNLEDISDEIHHRRIERQRQKELGDRGAGVGSESPSPPPSRSPKVDHVEFDVLKRRSKSDTERYSSHSSEPLNKSSSFTHENTLPSQVLSTKMYDSTIGDISEMLRIDQMYKKLPSTLPQKLLIPETSAKEKDRRSTITIDEYLKSRRRSNTESFQHGFERRSYPIVRRKPKSAPVSSSKFAFDRHSSGSSKLDHIFVQSEDSEPSKLCSNLANNKNDPKSSVESSSVATNTKLRGLILSVDSSLAADILQFPNVPIPPTANSQTYSDLCKRSSPQIPHSVGIPVENCQNDLPNSNSANSLTKKTSSIDDILSDDLYRDDQSDIESISSAGAVMDDETLEMLTLRFDINDISGAGYPE